MDEKIKDFKERISASYPPNLVDYLTGLYGRCLTEVDTLSSFLPVDVLLKIVIE